MKGVFVFACREDRVLDESFLDSASGGNSLRHRDVLGVLLSLTDQKQRVILSTHAAPRAFFAQVKSLMTLANVTFAPSLGRNEAFLREIFSHAAPFFERHESPILIVEDSLFQDIAAHSAKKGGDTLLHDFGDGSVLSHFFPVQPDRQRVTLLPRHRFFLDKKREP